MSEREINLAEYSRAIGIDIDDDSENPEQNSIIEELLKEGGVESFIADGRLPLVRYANQRDNPSCSLVVPQEGVKRGDTHSYAPSEGSYVGSYDQFFDPQGNLRPGNPLECTITVVQGNELTNRIIAARNPPSDMPNPEVST